MQYSGIYKTGLLDEQSKGNKQVVEKIRVKKTGEDKISLENVLKELSKKGITADSQMVLFFSPSRNAFVYIGRHKNLGESFIPLSEISGRLIIKLRKTKPLGNIQEDTKQSSSNESLNKKEEKKNNGKRTKERKISDVIDKVSEWRRLYSGIPGPDGRINKCSLEDAAIRVGIAKKTLDDYLLQLRFGKKYGFDFNLYKDEKVGMLRSFVKTRKEQEKEQKASAPTENEPDNNAEGSYQ